MLCAASREQPRDRSRRLLQCAGNCTNFVLVYVFSINSDYTSSPPHYTAMFGRYAAFYMDSLVSSAYVVPHYIQNKQKYTRCSGGTLAKSGKHAIRHSAVLHVDDTMLVQNSYFRSSALADSLRASNYLTLELAQTIEE